MREAHAAYVETQIKTAAPQKLRLMLIEAAIRFASQARTAGPAAGEPFSHSLERARDVVTELITGIRLEKNPLNEAVRSLYAFVFKSLSEAQLLHDVERIDDALRVLEEERLTWQQVCELEPSPSESPGREDSSRHEVMASLAGPTPARSSFSLDA